jgi:hypothetical protein
MLLDTNAVAPDVFTKCNERNKYLSVGEDVGNVNTDDIVANTLAPTVPSIPVLY